MIALCIDYGNTWVKSVVYNHNGDILAQEKFNAEQVFDGIKKIVEYYKPTHTILCSVVYHSQELKIYLIEHTKFLLLDADTPLPIINAYNTVETLGADRLAAVVGAHYLYPKKNNLVICLGTCITYNYITSNRTFRGGAISPGYHMRLQAMHHFTKKLPLLAPNNENLLLGYDTETCMRSGATYGIAAELEGMIDAYFNLNKTDFNAILTGGDAIFFEQLIKIKIFAHPDLILLGLYQILKHNVS